jgi:hypothetical protein
MSIRIVEANLDLSEHREAVLAMVEPIRGTRWEAPNRLIRMFERV